MRRHLAHLSDEALVALVARGDEGALAELYDRVGRVAYGLAFRVLRDDRLAEDAVQEAFLGVWRTAAGFRAERAKASTWILTLVHRRAVDLVRREERRRADPLDDAARDAATTSSAEDSAWLGFERERVQTALRQLPGRPARGDRARLLRRLLAVRARGEARGAARYDQEQDVRRARAPARAPRRRSRGRVMETGIHELTAGYALDALDPAERDAFERHLADCAQCQEELASFWEVTGALARRRRRARPEPRPARADPRGARAPRSRRSCAARLAGGGCRRCSRRSPRSRPPSRSASASTRSRSTASSTTRAPRSPRRRARPPCSPTRTRRRLRMESGSGRVVVDRRRLRRARGRRPRRGAGRERRTRRGWWKGRHRPRPERSTRRTSGRSCRSRSPCRTAQSSAVTVESAGGASAPTLPMVAPPLRSEPRALRHARSASAGVTVAEQVVPIRPVHLFG